MMLKNLDLDTYLFGMEVDDLSAAEAKMIRKLVEREIREIFYGQNMTNMKNMR
jgi:S-adenosylmethionine decarboxylase